MAEINTPKELVPQLFDLSSDIVEYVPPEIIVEWEASDKSITAAKEILEPNIVEGTLISSDTSGLSKISQNLGLIEVMAMINKPKEIIYQMGKFIGGEAVGIWAADNTQMFYDKSIDPEIILKTVLDTQALIEKECNVKVGIGLHYGKFYNIGNGMYGTEADFIEHFAEDEVEGGEVVISNAFLTQMSHPDKFNLKQKNEDFVTAAAKQPFTGKFKLDNDLIYPIPFSREFLDDIRTVEAGTNTLSKDEIYSKYVIKDKIAVLIARENMSESQPEVTLLDELYYYGLMSKISMKLLCEYEGKKVKVVSNLGIFLFSSAQEAYEFTQAFHNELYKHGIKCKSGMAKGDVVLFHLPNGRKDIAGSPVNLASKLAEDAGQLGSHYIQKGIEEAINLADKTFGKIGISGVEIEYCELNIIK